VTVELPEAHDLQAVIESVPGVAQVYQPQSAVGALAVVAAGLVPSGEVAARPRVEMDQDHVVTVTIGTTDECPAPAVARAVHSAIEEHCSATGVPVARIHITVARIG